MTIPFSEETDNIIRNKRITQLCNAVNATYDDVEILHRYKEERDNYQLTKLQKKRGRVLWESPNYAVHKFLEIIFKPIYGPKWAFNKEVLTHPYVQPWLLVPLKEVM